MKSKMSLRDSLFLTLLLIIGIPVCSYSLLLEDGDSTINLETDFCDLPGFEDWVMSTPFVQQIRGEPYLHLPTGLVFPEWIAGMVKDSITDFESDDPRLGIGIGYCGCAAYITVTIYLYNLGQSSIPNGADSDLIIQHFQQVINDVYTSKHYSSVVKLSERKISFDQSPESLEALSAAFSYTVDGTENLSFAYLTGYKNHFFKIRLTYPKSEETKAKPTQTRFINEIGKLLIRQLRNKKEDNEKGK